MKVFVVFALITIGSTITALIQAAVLGKLWIWFVAEDYGPGPSMGGWFGISATLGLIVSMALPSDFGDREESIDSIISKSISRCVGRWIGCGLLLGLCWFIGTILGWIH